MRTVVIMGAGGRDFHDFNAIFRDDPQTRVVAFTAAQIPGIAGRVYPPALAGPSYPDGIAIIGEEELPAIVAEHDVDEVVLAYSDLSHEVVMHKASLVLATGADFRLPGPRATRSRSCATRCPTATWSGCAYSGSRRWTTSTPPIPPSRSARSTRSRSAR